MKHLYEIALPLSKEERGRRPTKDGVEGRIALLLGKCHCERLIEWRPGGRR